MVLCPVLGKLLHKRVVLASASPRRQEILNNAGLRFEVVPSRFKETLDKASFPAPSAYAVETAKQKALEVAQRLYQKDLRAPDVVIGADTIVALGGLILEKPVDKQDAYRMLSSLNGKEHSVFTGVVIVHCRSSDGRLDTEVSEFFEETRVKFSQLSEELLWDYINSGEPMDKAGGYGIQALGGMLVERVHGDFLNVVGFPLNHFCKCLGELYLQRPLEDAPCAPPPPPQGAPGGLGHVGGAPSDLGPGQATQEAARNGTLDVPPPFPSGLMELIDGFKASKALFTACKLGVFDLLHDAAPQTAEALARRTGASVGGLGRLLDVCAALGVLEKADKGYSNSACASQHLRSEGEYSLHSYVLHNHEHTWDQFTHLEAAVRTGAPQTPSASGGEAEKGGCSPRFLRAMHGLSKLTARLVAQALDLSPYASACDVGGGTGALAQELARASPRLTVTVFDLPEVVQHAEGVQPAGPWTERVSFRAGDFFQDALPQADLYVLSRVLHNWADDRVHSLLSRIARSCRPGAGLLLVESPLDEEKRAARAGLLQSLDALTRTLGRARTPSEYRLLLRAHGFGDVRTLPTGDSVLALLATRTGA
ncbi:probable bifunctional dTTP/UTP pyrophosphatase/methyltransferase protein isoform X2 [Sorex araneus]|uniref:probable bifunctional dTTP/UTP pyrophosphatase/methyltransferase protein isoform X2 n=1 Tax=Sorex araneus TaxID=42254 RepID=UPI002433577F|nr:probable bifunctional dTTP/UTP pyrophosphatase/methyltransferase protein isoform X2 [Sorex araneus]